MTDMIALIGGFVLLISGGEFLVRGAVQTAERLGMSQLLIGLTLVGIGTSMPELVTSVQASLAGSPGIAVGNIVGSNIANIFLVLGLASVIAPVAVSHEAWRRDGVLVVVATVLFCAVGYVASLDRTVGTLFIILLIGYLVHAYRQDREMSAAAADLKSSSEAIQSPPPQPGSIILPLMVAFLGLVVVIVGGKLLVTGASGIAREHGISESVIGLTIVALGTSMPEVVTSVIAAMKRHGDVALGNILGSCLYNILGIGGATALLSPTIIPPEIVRFDNLVMLLASLSLLWFARSDWRISRFEGSVLLTAYAAYLFVTWPR